MDANGLLTVIAVLIAGFTLLSEERRLDFKLRLSWLDIILVTLLSLIVLATIYQPVLSSLGWVIPIPWQFGFNESITSFTALLGITGLFAYKLTGSKLPKSKIRGWVNISDKLLREKKFDQLGFLFAKYQSVLNRESKRNPLWVRVHNWVYPGKASHEELLIELARLKEQMPVKSDNTEKVTKSPVKKDSNPAIFLYGLIKKHVPKYVDKKVVVARKCLAKLFPSKNKNADYALDSISRILKSKQFVSYISETYPLIAANATVIRFRDDDEYINTFFTALISRPESPLYREIRDNQSCSHTGEYYLDESNALLNFYLKDVSVARQIEIYRPLGDYIIEYIESKKGKTNYYNQACGRFPEGEEVWACPIFVGTQFFDLMVSSAIFQRKKDHMWLMYLEKFFNQILESLDHSSEVDKNDEFPSKYDYLLYNLLATCGRWVRASEHITYPKESNESYDDYPELWALKTYGTMLRKAIRSDKLMENQKIYFLEMVVRVMRSLDQQILKARSKVIFDFIIKDEFRPVDPLFVDNLKHIYREIDHVLRLRDSTFEREIKNY
jgi:hypothetical protein